MRVRETHWIKRYFAKNKAEAWKVEVTFYASEEEVKHLRHNEMLDIISLFKKAEDDSRSNPEM